MAPIAIPASELLNVSTREFIILAGKDGVGKTNALISLAEFVTQIQPDATFYVIDMENKFDLALTSYGSVPANLQLYKCETMNDATEAAADIVAKHQKGDWVAAESGGRLWERAQDLGYQAIKGMTKAEWMERRRATAPGQKQPPVTPSPDELWSIIKGAHDTAFMDLFAQTRSLNVVISTGVAKVKEARSNRKESQERVDFRAETGIDLNLEGAPRLPYYAVTGVLLERQNGNVTGRIWRDNISKLDDPAITFAVPTRRDFAIQFWTETGR